MSVVWGCMSCMRVCSVLILVYERGSHHSLPIGCVCVFSDKNLLDPTEQAKKSFYLMYKCFNNFAYMILFTNPTQSENNRI